LSACLNRSIVSWQNISREYQGVYYHYQQEGNWFSQAGKTISTQLLYKKKVSVRWPNQAAKVVSTASQFDLVPAT